MTKNITNNKGILDFIDKYAKLMTPDNIVWIDGSQSQKQQLTEEGNSTGEIIKLNNKLLPGCVYHRTAVNDVARVEHKTFICSTKKENAGPTNNWMEPEAAYNILDGIAQGCMKGRTMYIIPYSMGKVGSPFAKYGIELTDSIYVVLNMIIMTRVGLDVVEGIEKTGEFVKGIHSKVKLELENRYICHFPEDNLIYSLNSGYGGNVLLGKKCFALRIASYQAWKQGWMAEHMLILGIEKPNGEVKYVCGAFPSACGKTNLAMLIPPDIYTEKGYKVYTVGDDIAWLRPGKDGQLYAINPENGFFGVAPGTNEKSNPNALASTKSDTIFTNVVYIPQNKTVWWEGLDKNPPMNAEDWIGNKWSGGMVDNEGKKIKGANPNSRFTSPILNCPSLSSEFENPEGVPISAIIFGGRRAKAAPLVYESHNWQHGVFVGSIMASETTAAASGAVGVVRHDPMAMLPFCGYNMANYFKHWLNIGKNLKNPPKIFNVNWFRLDNEGDFIWPGFGDNMRVLDWILKRCENAIDALDTPIGYMPKHNDINIDRLDFTKEQLNSILDCNKDVWNEEAKEIENFYKSKFGDTLPVELYQELAALKARLN